jgi:hypothetical protein
MRIREFLSLSIFFCVQERLFLKLQSAVTSMEKAVGSGDAGRIESERQVLLVEARDVLSDWLDSRLGTAVTDNKIFSDLPRHWEQEFHKVPTFTYIFLKRIFLFGNHTGCVH